LDPLPPAELLETLSLPLRLALAYAPTTAKPAWVALLALDARLGAILRGGREPIAAQLRLAWWRERLEEPPASWPAGEPVLEALRAWRNPALLAGLPSGWEMLLSDRLTHEIAEQFSEARGQAFASLASELSPGAEVGAARAGRIWSAADLATNLSQPGEREIALAYGRGLPEPRALPRALRPMAVLAALGQRALRRGGQPLLTRRLAALLAFRVGLTGR
jgi:phytoene synthase